LNKELPSSFDLIINHITINIVKAVINKMHSLKNISNPFFVESLEIKSENGIKQKY
jgi:hypothetical protein